MAERSLSDAIAIVGMACRLPGADDLDQFWNLIRSGSNATGPLPPERLNRELYFDPRKGQICKTYSDLGGIVRPRPFDRDRCPLPDELIEQVDVAHLTLLDVAANACRHGGYDPYQLPFRNVGVFVGHTGGSPLVSDYLYGTVVEEGAAALDRVQELKSAGLDSAAIRRRVVSETRKRFPGRRPKQKLRLAPIMGSELIAEAFDLHGPFCVVDAACASSLQAMSIGIRSLLQGRLDAAIVGGASYCKSDSLVLFSAAQSVSSTATCPFSKDADGLITAEGYVVFLLKTLSRAVQDGDRIHAVISGLGVSSDGRGKSLWAPRAEGQILAVERAYAGDLDANRVQYIEAHATSTQVGDATELQALATALRKILKDPAQRIPIGSVKGNVGHTLETAGVAGLLKTVLAISKQTIPPAVRCRELNSEIDWSACPFYVPFEEQPWSEFADGHPRRAAVNSFGIGGLNVHVVVDEFQPRSAAAGRAVAAPRVRGADPDRDAIAIIGMGCIFPGAHTIDAFWDLLKSGRDPKIEAPPQRIPLEYHVPGEPQPWRTYALRGGFVEGWQYDWRRHKIPPKQIAQANPLQFMLLDAADQAFQNAGLDPKTMSGAKTAVIVGTIFGGDFSDQLQMGLRLPEFRQTLRQVLERENVPPQKIAAIQEEFQNKLLETMPALLDETGSFTSSTLASRITKSFNLMGGAMALDAGDCSGAMVIAAAVDQLRLGHADTVVCAAGQRSMDLFSYEGFSLAGCLARQPGSGLDASQDGFVPGEGCGVVILRRLEDARRDGNPIRGVIRGVGASSDKSRLQAVERAAAAALREAELAPAMVTAVETCAVDDEQHERSEISALTAVFATSERDAPVTLGDLASQIGHTGGGSAMAALLKSALATQHGQLPPTLHLDREYSAIAEAKTARANQKLMPLPGFAGTEYRAVAISSVHNQMAFQIVLDNGAPKPSPGPTASAPAQSAAAPGHDATLVARYSADSAAALLDQLSPAQANSAAALGDEGAKRFSHHRARCAILASGAEELARKLPLAADLIKRGRHDLAADQGIFFATETTPRPKVAFLFPGQGSQYSGMFRPLCERDPQVQAEVRHADELMGRYGFPTFSELAWNAGSPLGKDIWTTQIAVLLADWLAWRTTQHLGLRPDAIAGHSFGEFPALAAAGAWTIEEAILATRARCDAVQTCVQGPTTMLSLAAPRRDVEALLPGPGPQVWFCAENGPEQCIVGGADQDVQAFAAFCTQRQIRSRPLAVPCAFHTPLLEKAQSLLKRALDQRTLSAPKVPFVGTTIPCFLTQPVDLRASLVDQMTHPVEFAACIRRLCDAGVNTFVEVGPSQVLTTLARRIVGDESAFRFLAIDPPSRLAADVVTRLKAACQAWGISLTAEAQSRPTAPATAAPGPVRLIDATQRRRQRMRQQASRLPGDNGDSAAHPGRPTRSSEASSPNGNGAPHSHRLTEMPTGVPQNSAAPAGKPADEPRQSAPWDERTAQLVRDVISQHGLASGARISDEAPWASFVPQTDEFLDDLSECFDLQDSDRGKLERSTTLAELVELLQGRPGKIDWQSTRRREKHAAQPPAADLQQFLIDFVVEQTGYPPEIVELDADLEADLGIDSIKKAQLFGEIGHRFQLAADPNLSLDDFPTLRKVLDYLTQQLGQSGAEAPSADRSDEVPAFGPEKSVDDAAHGRPPELAGAARASGREFDAAQLQAFLIGFVVEHTGYPPEIVELDADLEADLGIDSIKKAQLFGEIGNHFQLAADPDLSLDDFPTLRHVLDYLSRQMGNGPSAVRDRAPTAQTAPPTHSQPAESSDSYNRGFVHGRSHRETIRSALRHLAARSADQAPAVSTGWFNELAVEEQDELRGVADGAGMLLENILAWQSAVGVAPLAAQALHVVHDGAAAVAVSGWAKVESPLCLEELPDMVLLRVPGQLGAVAGVNREGVVVAGVSDRSDQAGGGGGFPASIRVARALRSGPASAASDQGVLVTDRNQQSAHSAVAGSLTQIQQHLAQSPSPKWINGQPALGQLPSIQRYDLLVARELWLHGPADETARSGAVAWTRSDLKLANPASVPPPAAAPPSRVPVEFPPGARVTKRFVPRLVPAAPQTIAPRHQWPGAAILIGDSPQTPLLAAELSSRGIQVRQLSQRLSPEDMERQLSSHLAAYPQTSLVLALDLPSRMPADKASWSRASSELLLGPFRACQLWFARVDPAKSPVTLMGVVSLGGHLGLEGGPISPWSGGVAGLLKGIRKENEQLNVRIVDLAEELDASSAAKLLAAEFLGSNRELEVSLRSTGRYTVRYEQGPPQGSATLPQPGDQWVVSGGARGVTGVVARELGRRYGLRLHLLGTTRLDDVNPGWLSASAEELKSIRSGTMLAAKAAGKDPLAAWNLVEKSLEIRRQLDTLKSAGVEATYHVCDVADWSQLNDVLSRIRKSGPIRGIVHGAGFEAAARFEKKKMPLVERTIDAKAGGAAALIAATAADPIGWFVAFGSTSGRLGGLGQTDYSLANDLLAKQVAALRQQRPKIHAATFHWHAWDEIGMAARPESRFALTKLGLKFMPPLEGVAHLLLELEAGLPAAEVMITEDATVDQLPVPGAHPTTSENARVDEERQEERAEDWSAYLINFVVEHTGYPPEIVELDADLEADLGIDSIKKAQLFGEIGQRFAIPPDENLSLDDFPTLRHVMQYLEQKVGKPAAAEETKSARAAGHEPPPSPTPLLSEIVPADGGSFTARGTLDPKHDPFLTEHRMLGRPVLPGVTGCELLSQAVGAKVPRGRYLRLKNVEVLSAMRFPTDDPRRFEVRVARCDDGYSEDGYQAVLSSVVAERSGGAREHVSGIVSFPEELGVKLSEFAKPPFPYNPMVYPEEAAMYHGQAMRMLEGLMFQHGGGWGSLRSPGTSSLSGSRPAQGWLLPMALLDGCVVGCAVFSWLMCGLRVEIPQGFGELWLLGEPAIDETCQMQFRYLRSDARNTWYDFDLFGQEGRPIAACRSLRLAKFGQDEVA